MALEVCAYFQAGECRFGDRCRYLHLPLLYPDPLPVNNAAIDDYHQDSSMPDYSYYPMVSYHHDDYRMTDVDYMDHYQDDEDDYGNTNTNSNEPGLTNMVCQFHIAGSCRPGDFCMLRHSTLNQDAPEFIPLSARTNKSTRETAPNDGTAGNDGSRDEARLLDE